MGEKQDSKRKIELRRKWAEDRKKYILEKGIEIPEFYLKKLQAHYKGPEADMAYPFKDMEIGDSFLLPASKKLKNMRAMAQVYGNRYNMRFVITRDHEHKFRCWRVS